MEVHIYIAAGCRCPKKMRRKASYRLEVETPAGIKWRSGETSVDATLHQAELAALAGALSRLTKPCCLVIHTTSAYLCSSLRRGLPWKWAKNGWTTAKGEAVANSAEWLEVLEILKGRPFKVVLEGIQGENGAKP